MQKRRSLLMIVALLITIALYGCGGKKEDEKGNGNTSGNNMSPTEQAAGTQVTGTPIYGGNIVVGIQQDLDSLDPHKAVAAGTKEVLFNIFEGLVKPDKDGNLVPAVASSYDVSEDGKVYTFKLRSNVKFHNGSLVTADDVIYSLKRSAGLLEDGDPSIEVDEALKNILAVNKVDEETVEVVLEVGDTEIIGYLTVSIIPMGYEEQNTFPIGTGPFKFVSYSPLQNLIVEKNKDYYVSEEPYLDKVTFKIIENADTATLELMGGAIDVFPYVTDAQKSQVSASMNVLEGNMNLVQGLFLNNKVAPFDNIKVRQALYYATDRQGILDMVAAGTGSIIGSNMFVGFGKYYNEEVVSLYETNIEKAKKLLAEAGYENGFSFTITVPSNYAFHADTAQVLVEQYKQIGVDAKIKLVEWGTWIEDVYIGRKYESTIIGLDAKLAPRDVLERYKSTADNNFVNYNNEKFDDVLNKAITSIQDEEKVGYYKELQQILAEDAASIYIQDPSQGVALNKKLAGYEFYPVYVQDMSKVYFIK